MTKAIFYKEWIKLRWLLFAIAVVFVGVIPYFILNLTNNIRLAGSAYLWSVIVFKNISFIDDLTYLPIVVGLLLGLAQFVPEMQKKSLKLTLHLPHPEKLTIMKMLMFGSGSILAIFSITGLILYLILSIYLPTQILATWFSLALPWYLAGIAAYFLSVWVCIEPSWKQRAYNSVIALIALTLFFEVGATSFSFIFYVPVLLGIVVVSALFPYYSVYRFKEGVQE